MELVTAFDGFSCHTFWFDSKMYFLSLRTAAGFAGYNCYDREEHSPSSSLFEK